MSLAQLPWRSGFAALPESFFQRVSPTPLPEPYLVAFNRDLAEEMGIDPDLAADPETLAVLSGNQVLAGTSPVAAVYAGHQFGIWVPQLGDGRAILLGEIPGPDHRVHEVQLKGSGPTRYSRMGDGRAVLRSTIREYLASEAMHGLGIPTTRALAIVGSDLPVFRGSAETAAVLTRVAPTFVRFGSFEYFASIGQADQIKLLADHVIERHFPALLALPDAVRYPSWYREVVFATARLMADWMSTGWTHGVMNTDNMSILGLTLDYGPYGWLDEFQTGYTPNHTDQGGRYAYCEQPVVGLWNVVQLAGSILTLVPQDQVLDIIDEYQGALDIALNEKIRAKLGLATSDAGDIALQGGLFGLMRSQRADYTRVFRALSHWDSTVEGSAGLAAEFSDQQALRSWTDRYQARLAAEGSITAARHARMLAVNPKYVLRNWMAQEAITLAETGSYQRIELFRKLLATPFDEQPEHEEYAAKPPEWAKGLVLSCSS